MRHETVSATESVASPPHPPHSFVGLAFARLRSTATILAVFLVSLTFVLGLVTLLDYFKFESTLSDLADRRIGVIIDHVHSSLETAIDLGLNLRGINAARSILENTQAQDERIKAVLIFGANDGRILFSSIPASVGGPVDRSWLAAQARAGNHVWRIARGDHVLVGQRLESAVGTVGGVVLDYSLADVAARIDAARDHLVGAALLTLAVFSFVALIGAVVVTREFRRTVAGLTEAIASHSHSAAGSVPESLLPSVERFQRATSEAQTQLDRLEDSLAPASIGGSPPEVRSAGKVR